jgi:elongator complex protein 1
MKNLSIQGERRRCIRHGDVFGETSKLVDICEVLNESLDSLRILLDNTGKLVCLSDFEEVVWTCELSNVCMGSRDISWFSLTYVDPILVCMSHDGAIVKISPETGEAEIVGEFENGIEAGCWSPDCEILLLVTSNRLDDDPYTEKSVLLSMNARWEVLAETNIETHASAKLDLANEVSVCWKPDGTLCAVSSVDASDSARSLRIYKGETLALHAIGRSEDGTGKLVRNLQPTKVAWAGPGCSQFLASVQRKGKNTQVVVFFEPNGLRHREFTLREHDASVVLALNWNADCKLLALSLRAEKCDKVQIWHRSNYHWYLKQEFVYNAERIASVQFHTENPSTLYVLFDSSHSWREYKIRWDSSTVLSEPSSCNVFVIDGCMLKVTPLVRAIIPPPLSAAQITFPFSVKEVAFIRHRIAPIIGVVQLSNGSLHLLAREGGEESSFISNFCAPKPHRELDTSHLGFVPMELRNMVIVQVGADELRVVAILCATESRPRETFVDIAVSMTTGHTALLNSIDLKERVLAVVQWCDSLEGALVELEGGHFLEYEVMSSTLLLSQVEPLLEPCPWIAALKNNTSVGESLNCHQSRIVVGLSARHRLYCNDLLLCDAASSFEVSMMHLYLCFVSSGSHCQMRFIALRDLWQFDPLMGSEENVLSVGFEPRNVERGTGLVAILPTQPAAVLQMPRGNLETIYPRALVLRYSLLKISDGRYGEAFRMMRRQKIDLNLIVDVNPWYFLDFGLAVFIKEVYNIHDLNLFISGLQASDCTQSRQLISKDLRQIFKTTGEHLECFDFSSKVNQICAAMRKLLTQMEMGMASPSKTRKTHEYLLPILSTYAKEDPPKLEEALALIKKYAVEYQQDTHSCVSDKKPALFSEYAQSSIQYLAFLAEYDLLFSTALGMYDYEIARAVARNSQMDPKVYLPLLKRYKDFPVFYGRYEVDLRLKRYERALRNLHRSGVCQEFPTQDGFADTNATDNFRCCMKLIEEHSLHGVGLKLFEQDETKQAQIMLSLGDQMMTEKKVETALSLYLACSISDTERIKRAARVSQNWRVFFQIAMGEITGSDAEHRKFLLGHEVADELATKAEGSVAKNELLCEAARILLDYACDPVASVDMLIRAENWVEAKRIGELVERNDLCRKTVEAACSYVYSTIEDLQNRAASFFDANKRYAEVIKIRREAVASGDGEEGEIDDGEDDSSVFSSRSNASFSSLPSTASTGSVGSTASLSSIISIKSTSSFNLVGTEETNRHKSKYNRAGRNKIKKKKRGKSSKIRPGSVEELDGLVQSMKSACLDDGYSDAISKTVIFLIRTGEQATAKKLFSSYVSMTDSCDQSRRCRWEAEKVEQVNKDRNQRSAGGTRIASTRLSVEDEVDTIKSSELSSSVYEFFSYFDHESSYCV